MLTDSQAAEIERGKDFVQLKSGPFDADLVFAPDGIATFADAWQRRVEVEGFPVCHPDDIIASKEAANRVRDRESLPAPRAGWERVGLRWSVRATRVGVRSYTQLT